MTKAELERKKNLARTLYMAGKEQAEIAEQIEVSRVTISKWANTEGWKEQRAAKNVTRPELVNKLLLTIDTLISQVNESGDPDKISGLGDRLAKLSSVQQVDAVPRTDRPEHHTRTSQDIQLLPGSLRLRQDEQWFLLRVVVKSEERRVKNLTDFGLHTCQTS